MKTAVATKRTPAEHPHYPISLSDLAQALDHSDEGFALTDPDGNYVYINDAHLRMYGYEKPQDLLGRSWRTLYTPEWVQHFEQAVLPIMPRDLVWRGQVIGKRRDGSAFLAGVTLTLLPDGKITCNCRDESVRREAPDAPGGRFPAPSGVSAERAALRELGERIVAGLPAKFHRPLEMFTGHAAMILGDLRDGHTPEPEILHASLAEMETSGRRLAEQMRRLELVAELTARDESPAGENCGCDRLADWPRRLAAACREKAAALGRSDDLRVRFQHASLRVPYQELCCAVLELLDNACKSSQPGVAIEVCGKALARSYVLRVCDEGVGLAEEDLAGTAGGRPLGQAAPRGFGFALVRYILRRNGATIVLDRSRPGVTCLKVTFPNVGN